MFTKVVKVYDYKPVISFSYSALFSILEQVGYNHMKQPLDELLLSIHTTLIKLYDT